MTKLRKFAAAVMTAAFAALICIFPASAAVEAHNTIRPAVNGKTYKVSLSRTGVPIYFTAGAESKGELTLYFSSDSDTLKILLYDEDENIISPRSVETVSGEYDPSSSEMSGTAYFYYKVRKGTYYISFEKTSESGNSRFRFKAEFPSQKTSSGNSSSSVTTITTTTTTSYSAEGAEINTNTESSTVYDQTEAPSSAGNTETKPKTSAPAEKSTSSSEVMIYLEPGAKLYIGALIGGKEASADWSSSDKNVASVSANGKVTAVSEGTAVITGKKDGSTVRIVIKVEK